MAQKSLWTDHRDDADHAWFAAPPEPPAREPDAPPPPPPRSPRRRRAVAGLAALLLLGGGAAGTVAVVDGRDGDAPRAAAPLPVSNGGAGPSRVKEIYARASKGVVSVRTGTGSGTGFLIDDRGTVVTNAHVVGSARDVQLRADEAAEPIDARVSGTDPSSDLAVLRIDPADAGGLQPLTLADSDDVAVGDAAIAIGYPLGLDRTATAGIVSGLGRSIEAPNGFSIDEVIQTDAPINPGNSGGPLLDARGRVIGVNSQIATSGGGGGNVGIGFAVPSNTLREVIPQLAAGRRIERPYLGVSTSETAAGTGAQVREVTAGGPASRQGLRVGDVIVEIDGEPVTAPDDVSGAIAGKRPGDTVELRIERGGAEQTLEIELGERPASVP